MTSPLRNGLPDGEVKDWADFKAKWRAGYDEYSPAPGDLRDLSLLIEEGNTLFTLHYMWGWVMDDIQCQANWSGLSFEMQDQVYSAGMRVPGVADVINAHNDALTEIVTTIPVCNPSHNWIADREDH